MQQWSGHVLLWESMNHHHSQTDIHLMAKGMWTPDYVPFFISGCMGAKPVPARQRPCEQREVHEVIVWNRRPGLCSFIQKNMMR